MSDCQMFVLAHRAISFQCAMKKERIRITIIIFFACRLAVTWLMECHCGLLAKQIKSRIYPESQIVCCVDDIVVVINIYVEVRWRGAEKQATLESVLPFCGFESIFGNLNGIPGGTLYIIRVSCIYKNCLYSENKILNICNVRIKLGTLNMSEINLFQGSLILYLCLWARNLFLRVSSY